eukprot:GFUD01004883.1.p1 GENE.GFUD01004883.1~~GFUD01004883.1.p1  ORF type:complete len:1386 (+),score=410.73 GFUD01004883.1:97-4254(+)
MPPTTQPHSAMQPDKNLTFTQFFTKLLIKVPQVDIERLPPHLLAEIVPCQEDYNGDLEADIYSMEHQENVEEFNTNELPVRFLQPLKTKKILQDGTDLLNVSDTLPEMDKETSIADSNTDFINCAVEESDMNCPKEETLDLTITDEFTEECIRENGSLGPVEVEEEKMEICVDETRVSEEKEQKESSEVFEGDAASDIDQDCAELMRHLEETDLKDTGEKKDNEHETVTDINPEDKTTVKEIDGNRQEKYLSDTDRVKGEKVQELQEKQFVQPDSEANINFANILVIKSDSNETPVEPKCGAATAKNNEKQSDSDSYSISSDLSLEHIRNTELDICDIETLSECRNETPEDHEDSNIDAGDHKDDKECVDDKTVTGLISDNATKEQYPEKHRTDDSLVEMKDNNIIEDKLFEAKNAKQMNIDNTKQDVGGGVSEHKFKCGNSEEKEMIKELNKEEKKPEPPALKIRIFKGNSGELINEKEAKRIRKRKKKMEKQKVKMAKISSDKAVKDVISIAAPNAGENDTQNRIIQELPRCNWLEEKIKNAGSSINFISQQGDTYLNQVDALLESDSEDDYLVVDDQHESSEVTTNFNEISSGEVENEIDDQSSNYINENQNLPANIEVKEFPNTAEETEANSNNSLQIEEQGNPNPELKEVEVSNNSEDDDIQEIHPFSYMLGNLMKKMDDNTSKRKGHLREELCPIAEPPQISSEQSVEVLKHRDVNAEKRVIMEAKQNTINACNHGREETNQTAHINTTEEIKQIPYQKRQERTTHRADQRTNQETNIYEKSTNKLKPIQFVKATEEFSDVSYQQQPEEVKQNEYERTIEDAKQKSHERSIEEGKHQRKEEEAKRKSYRRKIEETKRESYERTQEESKQIADQNAQNYIYITELHFQKQMLENKKIEEQLVKDIEELKNKKIKEMEDLIDIKSKKEQSMTDLEKIKLEIMKYKTFLESLKKINLREEAPRINSPPAAGNTMDTQSENRNTLTPVLEGQDKTVGSPKPLHRAPQSHQVMDKQLPDLVNHERFINKDQNVQPHFAPDHLRHLNLSQDYLKHLQRIQETNKKSLDSSRYPEKTPPPQLYNNQHILNQNQTPHFSENQKLLNPNQIPHISESQRSQPKYTENIQSSAPNNSKPQQAIYNIQNPEQQHQVPMLLKNSTSNQDKYRTNIHTFFPSLVNDINPGESNQFSQQRPQQKGIKPVSITRVPTTTEGIQRRPEEARRENGENKTIPKLVEGGFIRPREFSREAALTPPNEVSRLMNNLNNQYAVRNFLQNLPNPATQPRPAQPNQTRQEIPGNLSFPEIRNAIAAATDKRDLQSHMKNSAPIRQHPDQQRQSPNVLSKCAVCTKVANFLCSGCQNVYYCTVQCQTSHWLSHYIKCKGATN